MEDITGKREKRVTMQIELTEANEANMFKYQGMVMMQEGKRISKQDVVNKALSEFFNMYLGDK